MHLSVSGAAFVQFTNMISYICSDWNMKCTIDYSCPVQSWSSWAFCSLHLAQVDATWCSRLLLGGSDYQYASHPLGGYSCSCNFWQQEAAHGCSYTHFSLSLSDWEYDWASLVLSLNTCILLFGRVWEKEPFVTILNAYCHDFVTACTTSLYSS